ncbi:MAG: hypothetical protein IJV37_00170 [Bacteroidales bacterium]|nr:hypothetical protein [Bacteroidales bacterium]
MKKFLYLGLVAVMLPALVACNGGGKNGPVQINWRDGDLMAVAFLGYYDSFAEFESAPSYIRLTQAFPQIVEAVKVEAGLGREIYLAVPRDPMATVAVNEAGEFVTDENRTVFYRSEEGKPVLVLNNWYEDNSQIVCTDNAGNSVSFLPGIDPRDGRLKVADDYPVQDISLPMPKPMEGYTFFDYGEDFEGRDLGIRVRLQAGQPILTCSAKGVAGIGYDEESIVLADGDNVFSGINGLCKGVFLGTIGQDYNPVACVVMEDGSVKMSSIFYAMRRGGPDLSAALPGFKDVTGFESGGGGEVATDDGDSFYTYETIYALDARGARTEIPYFSYHGTYYAKDGRFIYEAALSPDWNYTLTCIDREEYAPETIFSGSFFEKASGEEEQVFTFQRSRRAWAGDERFEYDYKPVSGTFSATEQELAYRVNLTGTDIVPSGLVFQDGHLMESSIYEE